MEVSPHLLFIAFDTPDHKAIWGTLASKVPNQKSSALFKLYTREPHVKFYKKIN